MRGGMLSARRAIESPKGPQEARTEARRWPVRLVHPDTE
jgi:hypothetical protein